MHTDHLFIGDDGALYDTRREDWTRKPLRAVYAYHYREIENSEQLRATLRAGEYVWPGGYRLALITGDGQLLCFDCARSEYRLLSDAIRHDDGTSGWKAIGCDIVDHYDGLNYCDECGEIFTDTDGG